MPPNALAATAECHLPSDTSARELLAGDYHAIPMVVACVIVRSGLIAIGLTLAGHPRENLVRESVAGALVVEAFIIGWLAACRKKEPV